MLGFLGRALAPYALKLLAGAAIIGAILAVLAGARNAGRTAERVEGMRRQLDNVKERQDVENEVRRIGGDAARERLYDRWSRD